jgi:hypothetical protein
LVVVAIAVVLSLIQPAAGATLTWNALDGKWSVAGNWSPAGVPAGGDTANVLNTDGVSRTITYDYTGPAITLAFLSVDLTGGMPTDTETLSMAANNLTSAFEYVGWSAGNGSGTFNQSGGVNWINGTALHLGLNPTDNGYYNLSGTGSIIAGGNTGEVVGYSGTGNFTQNGGLNSIVAGVSGAGLYLGYNSGSSGTYTLNGGSLRVATNNAEYVGYFSAGSFIQTGGTNIVAVNGGANTGGPYALFLGYNPGITGSYSLGGTGSLESETEYVGYGGTGTFTQSGGTNTLTNDLTLTNTLIVRDRPLVDPIQKLAKLFASELLDRHSAAPFLPLPQSRLVLVPSATRRLPGAKVFCHSSFEGRRHWLSSSAAGACSMQNPYGRWRCDASCSASHRSPERKGGNSDACPGHHIRTELNLPRSNVPVCGLWHDRLHSVYTACRRPSRARHLNCAWVMRIGESTEVGFTPVGRTDARRTAVANRIDGLLVF